MEEMPLRFPHLGEQIFDSLSNESLQKCKKVARFWHNFIVNEYFDLLEPVSFVFGLKFELGLDFDKNLSKLTKYYFPGVSPQNVKRPPVWKLPSMTQQRLPGGPVEQLREK